MKRNEERSVALLLEMRPPSSSLDAANLAHLDAASCESLGAPKFALSWLERGDSRVRGAGASAGKDATGQ